MKGAHGEQKKREMCFYRLKAPWLTEGKQNTTEQKKTLNLSVGWDDVSAVTSVKLTNTVSVTTKYLTSIEPLLFERQRCIFLNLISGLWLMNGLGYKCICPLEQNSRKTFRSGDWKLSIPDRNIFFSPSTCLVRRSKERRNCCQRINTRINAVYKRPPPPSLHICVLIVSCRHGLAGCNVPCIAITDQLQMTAALHFFFYCIFFLLTTTKLLQSSHVVTKHLPFLILLLSRV